LCGAWVTPGIIRNPRWGWFYLLVLFPGVVASLQPRALLRCSVGAWKKPSSRGFRWRRPARAGAREGRGYGECGGQTSFGKAFIIAVKQLMFLKGLLILRWRHFQVGVKLGGGCGRPTACNVGFLSRPGASPAERDYPGLVCIGLSGLRCGWRSSLRLSTVPGWHFDVDDL
jgi:hypothetical protein